MCRTVARGCRFQIIPGDRRATGRLTLKPEDDSWVMGLGYLVYLVVFVSAVCGLGSVRMRLGKVSAMDFPYMAEEPQARTLATDLGQGLWCIAGLRSPVLARPPQHLRWGLNNPPLRLLTALIVVQCHWYSRPRRYVCEETHGHREPWVSRNVAEGMLTWCRNNDGWPRLCRRFLGR